MTREVNIDTISAINLARCNRWHPGGLDEWSVSDWAVAMAGEAGEVCNAVKKLRRVEDSLAQVTGPSTREQAIREIGDELADTYLYLDLLAHRLGIDLPEAITRKFNAVSVKVGFPERLGE